MVSARQKTFDQARQVTLDAVGLTQDATINANGHLVVNAFLSRPGIFEYSAAEIKPQWPTCDEVQKYPDNAILRAYRPPEELAKPQYLDSAKLTPITNDHPPDMLHPETTAGHPVGVVSEDVKIVDGKPCARIVLWTKDAIDGYHAGKKEISQGAYNRFVWGPGTTEDGEPYDFAILDTINNHTAMVDAGRAGPAARIFDSAPAGSGRKEPRTMKVTIKNATFDLDDNAAKLLEAERAEVQATTDRLTGEIDALKKKELTKDEVNALVEKELKAREEKGTLDKRRAAVKDAGYEVEGKSDDYISGVFETIDASTHPADNATTDAGVRFNGKKKPEKVTRDDVRRAKADVYS